MTTLGLDASAAAHPPVDPPQARPDPQWVGVGARSWSSIRQAESAGPRNKHGTAWQVHLPLKLRQQRTFVMQRPTCTQLDVLHSGGATSAGRNWPPRPAGPNACVPE
jgi:hypothetical protein